MTMEGVDAAVENVSAPIEQPTLTADQVRKVVQREKAAAEEKARREMQAQYEKELAELRNAQPKSVGGIEQSVDSEKLYSQFRDRLMQDVQREQEESRLAQHQKEMHEVAGNYLNKMAKGKDLYEDFDAITGKFEPEAFPQVIYLASRMENTADIIYELSKNPSKLVMINDLAQRSPQMAEDQLRKLVDSINQNRTAKSNNVSASPPLSRLQPSATAGTDSGALSISDFKKMKWLKA